MPTIIHRFLENSRKFGPDTCLVYKDKDSGRWLEKCWEELFADVSSLTDAIKKMGIAKGESVAIFSSTRMEWTVLDLAILASGAVSVPVYTNLSPDQICYILNHSRTKVIFVENKELRSVIEKIRSDLMTVEKIFIIDSPEFSQLLCSPTSLNEFHELTTELSPDDIATCVYTSGTTGEPKGVDLTHANIVGEVAGLAEVFRFGRKEAGLLFLPLSHVIARAFQFYQIDIACITAYAESIDKIPQNLLEVRPDFIAAVPRVLEKIHEMVLDQIAQMPYFIRKVIGISIEIGKRYSDDMRKRKPINYLRHLEYWLISKLVFARLHKRLGGKLRYLISGGAPLSETVAEFFHATGFVVAEGYGLTETFAAITLNRPDDFKFGTVGKPLFNTHIRLAEDGEILVKGPQIFKGYRQPSVADDNGIFVDGYFKTGDIGEFSRDGFLRITDRKKEIIITASGKNISPQRVEGMLKNSRYISDVFVYGDKHKFLCALVAIDVAQVKRFFEEKGLPCKSDLELVRSPETFELIKNEIESNNKALSRHETVKKFAIIDHGFSIATGELTPTMKLKRRVVGEKYKEVIEKMYNKS